jgi:polysaccharide biosynthesis/export protein
MGATLRSSAICSVLIVFLCVPFAVFAQAAQKAPVETNSHAALEEYKVGPDDVLSITVTDSPEFGGKVRVSDTGTIAITGVDEPIKAEGLTAVELSHAIHDALVTAKQLRDPRVSVFIDEYHGRNVTVLGSVTKAGVYTLTGRTTVLEALSLAGGPLPNSGNTVTITRGPASAEATNSPVGSVQIIDLARARVGKDPGANVEVRNGDVIDVSAAEVVYVVGAVTKPGGFALPNPPVGVSVVQAVALAQGFTSVAATHRGLILRQSTSSLGRQEIPVDIDSLMKGKETDLVLAPNDILYVPDSAGKKTLKVMGEVAMALVNGIAIYGVGYRLGTANF